jgi:hypothetical protein
MSTATLGIGDLDRVRLSLKPLSPDNMEMLFLLKINVYDCCILAENQ